jgi:hypothetical protein
MSDAKNQFQQLPFSRFRSAGNAKCDLRVRHEGIHLLGILHRQPQAIDRVIGAIARYEPDLVAVEAHPEVVQSYHPDVRDPRWPSEHEVEAAAFAADRIDDLFIAGIDSDAWDQPSTDMGKLDAEIFCDMGLINSPEEFSTETYYELTPELIREWRAQIDLRAPFAFHEVLRQREDTMAGHLIEVYQAEAIETIIAPMGVQHLTGILRRFRDPDIIPDEKFEFPPVHHYRTI